MSTQFDHPLFDTEGAIYMGSRRDPNNCTVGLFGIPYDGTTSFRTGTRFGPAAIREGSNGLESYCPQLALDLEDLEHSISSGAVAAVAEHHPDLVLVQLDAHADLRAEWLGSRHSHACAMRRCLEVLPSQTLLQLSIRSGSREEFNELERSHRLMADVAALNDALTPLQGRPTYLTVDLDWFDPAVLPGTGTPEPGGYDWSDFAALVAVLKRHRLVAADVVELAPQLDPTGVSAVLASKVTRSLLLLLGHT